MTLQGGVWISASQAIRQIIQFAVTVILARLLSPREFGLVGMMAAITGFANVFTDMGLGAALVQRQSIHERQRSTVFWVNAGTGLMLSLITLALGPVIAWFYGEPQLSKLVAFNALILLATSLRVTHYALLQRDMRFRFLALVDISTAVLAGIAAVVLAVSGAGVWSIMAQSFLLAAIPVSFYAVGVGWRPQLLFDLPTIRDFAGFSGNLLGFNVVNYWSRSLDTLLIGKYIGSVGVGLYARATNLMQFPVIQIANVVSQVAYPALSRIQDDMARMRDVYMRMVRMIALVTFPLMIGLLVTAAEFVRVLYGEKWIDVTPILRVFCVIGLVNSVSTTTGLLFTVRARTDIMFRWGVFVFAVLAVAYVIGVHWGTLGVAIAYGISIFAILWYPGWTIPCRLIDLRFGEMIGNVSSPFLCAAAMGGCVAAARAGLAPIMGIHSLLLVEMAVGVVVYVALARGFRIQAYSDVEALIGNAVRQWRRGRR